MPAVTYGWCIHRGGNDRREAEFDLLICCGSKDVDGDIFAAANESGLVYDGRLVVDGRFRTADASIYAGGTLTKHSRRFGRDRPWHDRFNRGKLGQPCQGTDGRSRPTAYPVSRDERTGEATPPSFSDPKGTSACFPGELYYTHIEPPQCLELECQTQLLKLEGNGYKS